MPQLINYGNEMLRISPKGIEYSTTNGRSWNTRYSGSTYGAFIDLLPYGNELLAVTTYYIEIEIMPGLIDKEKFIGELEAGLYKLNDGIISREHNKEE